MARNRKRAKDRRRATPVAARRVEPSLSSADVAPDPLAHATPDAELAEAQLAVGRLEDQDEVRSPEDEVELEELATGEHEGNGQPRSQTLDAHPGRGGEREAARPSGASAERRVSLLARLLTFLQGSWAELQRVQWPDRRQVMQATGVVLGFVVVAGLFLGLSDLATSHLMTWILK